MLGIWLICLIKKRQKFGIFRKIFFKDLVYFRERGREGERVGEKH